MPAERVKPERVKHANLREAIRAIMEEVPYLLKVEKEGLGYKALMEGEVIGNLHPAMVKHGVVIHPAPGGELVHKGTIEVGQQKRLWNHVIIKRPFQIRHVDSDEVIEVEAFGEAMNPGDKAIGAAQTYALKYALRQAFMIESGDDPDRKGAAEMERRRTMKLDASAAKAEKALTESATKENLLKYRRAYLGRDFDYETVQHLEGIFWTHFPLCTGDEAAPDPTKEPAFKVRPKPKMIGDA